jgi:hypothetical protein
MRALPAFESWLDIIRAKAAPLWPPQAKTTVIANGNDTVDASSNQERRRGRARLLGTPAEAERLVREAIREFRKVVNHTVIPRAEDILERLPVRDVGSINNGLKGTGYTWSTLLADELAQE